MGVLCKKYHSPLSLKDMCSPTNPLDLLKRCSNMRYRGRWEIILEVLEATGRGAKKTHIMQKANLNYLRASMLLEELSSRGLIVKDGDADGETIYKLTEKGKSTLNSGRIWKMNFSEKHTKK
jgi:predicted transcriptional regulator